MDDYQRINPLRLSIDPLPTNDLDRDLFKAHANVENPEWDQLLDTYLPGAIEAFENDTHRTVIARTHRWVLAAFPTAGAEIRLPRGKTSSVGSIEYSQNGETVTLNGPDASPTGTDFVQDLASDDGGILRPAYGTVWPSADYNVLSPVVINFTAGYAWDGIPKGILQAILFKATDHVEFRGAADIAARSDEINQRVWDRLISSYCLHRTYPICD